MHYESTFLAQAPALLIGKGAPYRGTVLVYHGLGSNKEVQEKELVTLAERNFLAVGVDAVGHGARRYSDFESRMDSDEWHLEFLSIVRQTADELPAVVEALRHRSESLGKIGLTGISMGGCVAFAAASDHRFLSAVAPVLGSPDWTLGGRRQVTAEWWQDSPHHHPGRVHPTPLLIQNAGRDRNVSPLPARHFAAEAARFYHDTPDRLQYIEYPESEHFMRPQDWELLWDRVANWFERFL